ncbi:Ig-like domain-containing protein [Planococcus shixiaomingii]|uniref:Ig-like domain-containing protein n=1 Tax=Planococcus shixiaomingii TaxID=3058393 RepID=UPI002616D7B9|nr:Ig-like domain-containing protein [Planococcus sp. N022]WKA53985.1 Ig-like domain-containing protein [Planococcus sp. N022]
MRKAISLLLIVLLTLPNFTYAAELVNTESTDEYIIISESATWSESKTVDKNIIVAPNVTLSIATGVTITLNADLIVYGQIKNSGVINLNQHNVYANNINMGGIKMTGDANYLGFGVFDPYGRTTNVGNLNVKPDAYPLPPLHFNMPDNNTVTTEFYNLKGSSVPGFKVKYQNKEVRVQQNGSFELPINLSEGQNLIEISLVNVFNKVAVTETININLEPDRLPPVLKSTNPLNNSENALISNPIKFIFNEDVVEGQNFQQIKLEDANQKEIPFQLAIFQNTVILHPLNPLEYKLKYKVVFPQDSIMDLKKNSIGESLSLTFSTELDKTPPLLSESIPVNNAEDVHVDSKINITFNEDIEAGLNYGNIKLTDINDAPIPMELTILNNKLTIIPKTLLKHSQKYSFYMPKNSINDISGNSNDNPITLSFSTIEKEKLPPTKPIVNDVIEGDTEITGTADIGSTVYVQWNSVIWKTDVDQYGKFKTNISQKIGSEQIVVIAKDAEGLESEKAIKWIQRKVVSPNDTQIKGRISKNTSWTKEKSPYFLNGDIYLTDNATLTIESGVEVRGGKIIITEGTLESIGTPENQVNFIGTNVSIDGNAKIQHTNFNSYSDFDKFGSGNLELKDSIFYGRMHVYSDGCNCLIEKNIFNYHWVDIRLNGNDNNVIKNNVFNRGFDDLHGQYIYYKGGSGKTIIENNSFISEKVDNSFLQLENSAEGLVVKNNYWNTTDEEIIEGMIFDGLDKAGDIANYKPYLSSPHEMTPTSKKLMLETITPINQKYGVSVNTEIRVKFNHDIEVAESGIRLAQEIDGSSVSFNKRVEGDELIISPQEPLKFNTHYFLFFYSGSIKSTSGLMYEDRGGISFLTNKNISPSLPFVKDVTEDSTSVDGIVELGTLVEVKTKDKVLGSVKTSAKGTFKLDILKQKKGTALFITATDKEGNVSETKVMTVKDVKAPYISDIQEVTDSSTAIFGAAEAGSLIQVKKGSTTLGSTTTDVEKKFVISIPKQEAGTDLRITATDDSGNISDTKEVKVKDVTPPRTPTVNDLTDQSTTINGSGEPNSLIIIKNGELEIGKGTASYNGYYSIKIQKQQGGTKLTIIAVDEAGNISAVQEVVAKDITPPNIPSVNLLDDNDTIITGEAEIGAKVNAYAGTKKLGSTVASNGTYAIPVKKQKAGITIFVYAVDAARNKSYSKTIKVIDKTAPLVPSVNTIGDNSITVSGKAETGAKVYAYVGSKKLGEATAKSGAYSIKIAKHKAGASISVYAIDPAKNKSGSKTVKVLDKTAPPTPTINKVTSKSTTISGKAEKSATVLVYNGSKKIGQGTVDSKGNFKVKITLQKKGSSLKVSVQDKAGNKSGSKTVKVN